MSDLKKIIKKIEVLNSKKQFLSIVQFVQKQSALCKMKEKQTPNGLRLLLTFDNVKSIRRALELMELMGQ